MSREPSKHINIRSSAPATMLRVLRAANCLSMEALAARSGVSVSTIGAAEKGVGVSKAHALALCAALNGGMSDARIVQQLQEGIQHTRWRIEPEDDQRAQEAD